MQLSNRTIVKPYEKAVVLDRLDIFQRAGVNLTHIDKCAVQNANWECTLLVDALGYRKDVELAEVIGEARAHANHPTVPGSYGETAVESTSKKDKVSDESTS